MPYLSCKVQKVFFYLLIISSYSFSKIAYDRNEEMTILTEPESNAGVNIDPLPIEDQPESNADVNNDLMPIDDESSKTEKPESSGKNQMLLENVISYFL